MTVFGIVAGVLQLIVPSYAFRLVRQFGARRVGWFIVTSFACLALLHLTMPLNVFRIPLAPELTANAALALGSIFLVLGMGHLEILCRERDRSLKAEQKLRSETEQLWKGETEQLTKTRLRLSGEVAVLKQREQVLALSVAQYEFLFRSNPQPMAIVDRRTGRFVMLSDAALHKFGLAPDTSTTAALQHFLSAEHAAGFNAQLQETCASPRQFGVWPVIVSLECTLTLELSGVDFDFNEIPARLLVFNDMTSLQQREDQRVQIEKLAAITEVSGALGKAFGTALAQIESSASVLSRVNDPQLSLHVKQISGATAKASHLSRQLLAVGGCHPLQPQPIDVNAFLRNLNPMLARLLGDRIILQNAFGSYVATVSADSRLLEHLFVTLVLNARDAIPGRGTITVSTSAVRSEANPFTNMPGGEFIRVCVRDNGPGLKPDVQARLFEPFVSSDAPDGLGLGLASCFGIARQHGGWMECTSEEQRGTEFRIFLPCAVVKEAAHTETRIMPRSDGTILLVEPDDRTRATARTALNWQGYRVIEADSSALALLLWERQSAQIQLVITATDLPEGVTGIDLAAQLQQTKPDVQMIFLSEDQTDSSAGTDGTMVIQKPFTREKLLETVDRVKAASSSADGQ